MGLILGRCFNYLFFLFTEAVYYLLVVPIALFCPVKRIFPKAWTWLFANYLASSAYRGQTNIVRFLLWLYPEVDARTTDFSSTALMSASMAGQVETARYLLLRGADVNARSETETTALMWSAILGHADVARLLLASGAEVEACTKFGNTALLEAAKTGHLDVVKVLLDHGANMLTANRSSMDALVCSAGMGHADVVEFLIRKGMSVVGKRGVLALKCAAYTQQTHIIDLLRAAGAAEAV